MNRKKGLHKSLVSARAMTKPGQLVAVRKQTASKRTQTWGHMSPFFPLFSCAQASHYGARSLRLQRCLVPWPYAQDRRGGGS